MDYEIKLPEGQKFKVSGPEGFTQEQAWAALQSQIATAPNQDPELLGFDPHREEGGAAGGIYKRAGAALLPSVGKAIGDLGSGLWSIITHPKEAWKALNETFPEDVFKSVKNDLTRHYGSWDRAQKTFEEDPARFLLDLATLGTGGAAIVRKIGMTVGRTAEKVLPAVAGRASELGEETVRRAGEAGRAGPGTVPGQEYRAGLGGQPSPTVQATQGMPAAPALAARRQAAPFHQAGQDVRAGGWMPRHLTGQAMGNAALQFATGGHLPPWMSGAIAGGGMLGSSPRLAGAAAYGAGALQRGMEALPRARTAGAAVAGELSRDQIQERASEALKDKKFKERLSTADRKILRAVQHDKADSRMMTAAQRVLGGYRPITLESRQEGGPVTAGRVYSVGEEGKETFVPDRGPSPAQAAGAAGTEAVGWVSDAWASILKGEKPPPLPGLPEAGKVPSTADPRPTQALGEETSFLSQLAGPPGAAVAKVGMATAGMGAAARKVGTWGGEQIMHELGSGLKGLAQYLTPEELAQVTNRNVSNLVQTFKGMPSADEMAAVAYSGRAKRGWYQQSAQALRDTFGDADAPRFASLLAALSPQTSVQSNTENALNVWMNWTKAGRPTDEAAIRKIMAGSVQGEKGEESVLEAWTGNTVRALQAADPTKVRLSGPKVNSFMLNLRDHVHEVTNDAWMARYTGTPQEKFASAYRKDPEYGGKTGFKSPGYLAMSGATRRAAERLSELTGDTWTPAEIQETIWSWAKTVREKVYGGSGVKGVGGTVADLLKAGNISHEEIADTPDFALLFTRGVFRNILEQAGYGETIKRVEAELGRASTRGRAAPVGTPTRAEGGPFAQPAYQRHLQRAGRRLETIEE